ncbi:Translation initiation factor 2 (IF-2; GTPase) [Alloactinosynnema sp. L-07]|uniref:toll/interleukin-1 receptor domain-containing protein n=1 Tax=Alloactinosynnema sp. L-07 TaxID=1653480 RepID=UPI00065F0156|nr:toll/interleukin-1 receptor domain-containing protein [Alloactinosynnema sp. L-07]CRK59113.1 Translation initiation factor 2 (IF-2; GTPase) [Alloactinosynnema sp. L-07]
MTIFVSYTRIDQAVVNGLREDLVGRLGRQVWMDREIHGGEQWWREIISTIQRSRVFVFALSKDSWRSQPCQRELGYAKDLGIPVLPVQVGPLPNIRIPMMETQIVDYRQRTADAAFELVAALDDLTARPLVLPSPLPQPPAVPFEYLYRIAEVLGPKAIGPDRQEEVIRELARHLKREPDEVARADIVKLLREFRERNELTIGNAKDIDEILVGIEAKVSAPQDGATRLPPTEHWRRGAPDRPAPPEPTVPEPTVPPEPTVAPEPTVPRESTVQPESTVRPESSAAPGSTVPPAAAGQQKRVVWPDTAGRSVSSEPVGPPPADPPRSAEAADLSRGPAPARGAVPTPESRAPSSPWPSAPPVPSNPSDAAPAWLTSMVNRGGPAPAPPKPPTPSAYTAQWWAKGTPPGPEPEPTARPIPSTPSPARGREDRMALAGALLGAMGVPFLFYATVDADYEGSVRFLQTIMLIVGGLGLSLSVVSATRGEARSRLAVVIAVVGLVGVVTFAIATGLFS